MDKHELSYRRELLKMDVVKIKRELEETEINHVLHVLITFATGGIWFFGWGYLWEKGKTKRKELIPLLDKALQEISIIDAKKEQPSQPSNTEVVKIACNWCAELIMPNAKICRFCNKEVQNT
ncbi:MAG: hypothetical protein JKX67_01060 [Colwellia sp.]|nr:hypothetical protein [Colwellia sp.]